MYKFSQNLALFIHPEPKSNRMHLLCEKALPQDLNGFSNALKDLPLVIHLSTEAEK